MVDAKCTLPLNRSSEPLVSFYFLFFCHLHPDFACWSSPRVGVGVGPNSLNLGLGLGFNPNPKPGLRGWGGVSPDSGTGVGVGVEPQPQPGVNPNLVRVGLTRTLNVRLISQIGHQSGLMIRLVALENQLLCAQAACRQNLPNAQRRTPLVLEV